MSHPTCNRANATSIRPLRAWPNDGWAAFVIGPGAVFHRSSKQLARLAFRHGRCPQFFNFASSLRLAVC